MRVQDAKIFSAEVPGDVLAQLNSVTCAWYVRRAALMSDAHLGYTVPIGSVLEMEGMVSPQIIGYDIGCGVAAVPTNLFKEDLEDKKEAVWESIRDSVHVKETGTDRAYSLQGGLTEMGKKIWKNRRGSFQLGTVGGGNHFVEIGYSSIDDRVWILVHSGSRGFGHGIATYYMNISSRPHSIASQPAQDYLTDYRVAVEYAKRNRMILLMSVKKALELALSEDPGVHWDERIDCVHNFISFEDNLLVHRKGAISAKYGELGIVAGNNIDGSYLTRGLGNKDSIMSCSHGAGRLMSRSDAKKKLNIDTMKKNYETYQVYAGPVNKNSLAESCDAYKDFDNVMEQQVGKLLKIENRIFPMVSFKG